MKTAKSWLSECLDCCACVARSNEFPCLDCIEWTIREAQAEAYEEGVKEGITLREELDAAAKAKERK